MSGTNGDEGESGRDGRDAQDPRADSGIEPLTAFDPTRIGPYLLLGRLGAGGMGRVFLARSESGRTVAVKVVHEEHAADELFRERFRREINAARRVGERYTAPVLDADPDARPPWVATGYVPGLSLDQVVRRYGPLPAESVHALADGLLRALKAVHDARIVHRDLKPSNVMLTVDGTRIIDFGIARALTTDVESLLTSTGMVIGSPGFMSPEQILGQSVDARSDVFAVGCVLMYAATGRLPFGRDASNQHAVMFQITQAEPDLEGVEDPALRALITRCLNKDPEQRPDADELLADPERVRPAGTGPWLPADVVAHLALQSARLLDAEAVPLREKPGEGAVDRTVDLRPQPAEPAAGPVSASPDGVARTPEGRTRRHRRFIVLPVAVVLAAGGGTFALLPYVRDSGGHAANARPPAAHASATPAGSNSATAASSSPPKDGKKGAGGSHTTHGQPGQSPQQADGRPKKPTDGSGAGGSDSGGTSGTSASAGSSGSTGSSGSSGSSGSTGSSGGGSSSGSHGSSGGSLTPTGSHRLRSASNSDCIRNDGNGRAETVGCSSAADQVWVYKPLSGGAFEVYNNGAMTTCLTADGTDSPVGAGPCGVGDSQSWTVGPSGRELRSSAYGQCLTVDKSYGLALAACSSSNTAQQWSNY